MSDYKALVCLFLRGGNDANNMIVPLDTNQFALYASARGPLALSQQALLPMAGVGYGLHPSLVHLNAAFASGTAVFIANVGPLVKPTTVAQYKAASQGDLPDSLMSHQDQQQEWETGGYHSGVGPGWAGLAADKISSVYNAPNLPMVTLLSPASNFGQGVNTSSFQVNVNARPSTFWCTEGGYCNRRLSAAQQLLTLSTGVQIIQTDQAEYEHAYQYNDFYNSVLQSATPLTTPFPTASDLAPALKSIATMIQLHSQIGVGRQIFLINYGSFDTHSAQITTQAALLSQVDQAVGTFISAMQELDVYDKVTLFTMSDFARTLTYNGSLGSDHAWGGHHFAVGGAVNGHKLYGAFPSLQLHGENDADGSGRWIPTTAASQYIATLAAWFGVMPSDLPGILPGLSNFTAQNMGFI